MTHLNLLECAGNCFGLKRMFYMKFPGVPVPSVSTGAQVA